MKSKLFLMTSVLVAALMLTISASGQDRSEKPGNTIKSVRVDLPCSVTEMSAEKGEEGGFWGKKLRATMHNNTDSWLAQGTTIHFEVKTKVTAPATHYLTFPQTTMVLGEMVPVAGSKILLEEPKPHIPGFPESVISATVCTAWYIK